MVYFHSDSVCLALITHSKQLSTGRAIEKQKGGGNGVEQVLCSIRSFSEFRPDSGLQCSIFLAADISIHSATHNTMQSASSHISAITQFSQSLETSKINLHLR